MRNLPLWSAETTDPQALHVQDCAWIDEQLAVIALCDGSQLVPEQDRRRFLNCHPTKHLINIHTNKNYKNRDETKEKPLVNRSIIEIQLAILQ